MTTHHTTTTSPAVSIKSIEIVYTVADQRGDKRVSVTPAGAYTCPCNTFALYGECRHTGAVKAQRKAEGRKF
jgi:hypothetical protein